jgi:hypothetical protein
MDPVPSQARKDPGEKLQGQATERALAVLQGVLAEAMDTAKLSPMVNAWRCMHSGRVPAFVELREADPSSQLVLADQSDSGGAEEADAEVAVQAHNKTDATSCDPEFQAFAEFVLESAVVGLVSESASGDWQPPS